MKRKHTSTSKPEPAASPKPSADAAAAPKPAASPQGKATTAAAKPKRGKPSGKAPALQKTAAGPKRMSGLDAAAKVLAAAREPMGCGELAERILAQKLWSTSGKTPAATLNAAMIREIRDKGKESRFKKVGRGKFAATK